MTMTKGEMIADILETDILYAEEFRANPMNAHHYQYQISVGRVFFVMLYLLSILACMVSYGIIKGMLVAIGVAIALAIFFSVVYLVATASICAFTLFLEWIDGK